MQRKKTIKLKKSTRLRRLFWAVLKHPLGFLAIAIFLLAIFNFSYQLYKKPTEFFSLLSLTESKTLFETWAKYKPYFKKNSTPLIPAPFLAALAQAESGGNPLASPEWTLRVNGSLMPSYEPASTSVGLYQFTWPTFEQARKFCIQNNQVFAASFTTHFGRCWWSQFYSRVWPSHSIEVASAYLHKGIQNILKDHRQVSLKNRLRLASVLHLCGEGVAQKFYRSHFSLKIQPRCGDHDLRSYIQRIESFYRQLGYHL